MFKKLFKSKSVKKDKNFVRNTEEQKTVLLAETATVTQESRQVTLEGKSSQSFANRNSDLCHKSHCERIDAIVAESDAIAKSLMTKATNKANKLTPTTSNTVSEESGFEFPPFRPFDDFLLGSARFDLPATIDSWGNRVKKNLLYYQTNYGIVALLIMIIIMMNRPTEFLFGIFLSLGIGLALTAFKLKGFGSLALISLFFPFIFHCCMVFLSGVLVSATIILIHATLRLRTLKNKIETLKIDRKRLKKSIMGTILNVVDEFMDSD